MIFYLIFVCDGFGEYLFVNEVCVKVYGVDCIEVEGLKLVEFYDDEDELVCMLVEDCCVIDSGEFLVVE